MDLATAALVAVIAGAVGGTAGALAVGLTRDMLRMRMHWIGQPTGTWRSGIQVTPAVAAPSRPPSPFRLFTDRAKRVLALSQDEALRFNHTYIGPQHLLLGLTREGEGVAARSLDALGVSLTGLRAVVEASIGRGDTTASPAEIKLADPTKAVFAFADEERKRLSSHELATEHLLLGLLHDDAAVALLRTLGLDPERVRMMVMVTLGRTP
jgi:hypothetical protein